MVYLKELSILQLSPESSLVRLLSLPSTEPTPSRVTDDFPIAKSNDLPPLPSLLDHHSAQVITRFLEHFVSRFRDFILLWVFFLLHWFVPSQFFAGFSSSPWTLNFANMLYYLKFGDIESFYWSLISPFPTCGKESSQGGLIWHCCQGHWILGCGVRYPPLLIGAGQSGCNRKNSPEAKVGIWVEEAANAADSETAKYEFRRNNWRSPQSGDQK